METVTQLLRVIETETTEGVDQREIYTPEHMLVLGVRK